MRLSLKNMRPTHRIALLSGIIVTFPVSVPVVALLLLIKRSKKKRSRPNKTGPIVDLRNKLWKGFGQSTANTILYYLTEGQLRKDDRAELAFELARWQAAKGDWAQSLELLTQGMELNNKLANRVETVTLLLEAHMRLDNLDAAQATLGHANSILNPIEFALAKSKLLWLQKGCLSDADRLKIINTAYASTGLARLKLINEDGGLSINNLTGHEIKPIYSEEKVSILILICDTTTHLDTIFRSIIQQSYQNLEIIVLDSSSDHEKWEEIQKYAEQDKRIYAIRDQLRYTYNTARNRALKQATGQYVTLQSNNAWSHPQKIEQLVAALSDNRVRGALGSKACMTTSLLAKIDVDQNAISHTKQDPVSFIARRSDIIELGGWDDVTISSEIELLQRFKAKYGQNKMKSIYEATPVTLIIEEVIPTNLGVSAKSSTLEMYLTHGEHWLKRSKPLSSGYKLSRTGRKSPYPVPISLYGEQGEVKQFYDIVLISDLSLAGGTRRCNEGYIAAATAAGLKVGLFNYPRANVSIRQINYLYLDLCYQGNVDLLVQDDKVSTSVVIIHHPPVMKYRMDKIPTIECDLVAMLVNQLPMQLKSETPSLYDPETVRNNCQHFFGQDPIWIPISGRVRDGLNTIGGYKPMLESSWIPPFTEEIKRSKRERSLTSPIRIGRHSRDHWTKWPATRKDTELAYCAYVEGIETQILGGVGSQKMGIGKIPENWCIFEFDSITVNDFLSNLDVFVNFMHSDYIEEFGRNTMEAMACGIPAILEHSLFETFGDAAIYCKPEEVEKIVRLLMSDPDLYQSQVEKGFNFVRNNCSQDKAKRNLIDLIALAKEHVNAQNSDV